MTVESMTEKKAWSKRGQIFQNVQKIKTPKNLLRGFCISVINSAIFSPHPSGEVGRGLQLFASHCSNSRKYLSFEVFEQGTASG